MQPNYKLAITDIIDGFMAWRLWGRMGWQENKRRYRRTLFGPFWTSLSLAIFVVILGIVWANLWKMDLKEFMPYITSGMIMWILISSLLTESCSTFTSAENLITQLRFPYTMLACTVVWRNLIVLFHNLSIYVFIFLYFDIELNSSIFWLIPSLFFVFINGVWVSIFLGLICSRFRDIQQVVTSLVTVALFVTPIIWSVEQLGQRGIEMVDFNLIYHFLNILRAPLLGVNPDMINWVVVIGTTILGWFFTLLLYSRFIQRIPFWI